MLSDESQYKLMHLLEENPEASQREIAESLGVSLGKVNYCMKALVDKGWVKIQNFRNSKNKNAYLYILTPAGIGEKVRVTQRFLARKLQEHEEIRAEIYRLRKEVHTHVNELTTTESETK